jgi:hypothetical protein
VKRQSSSLYSTVMVTDLTGAGQVIPRSRTGFRWSATRQSGKP